MSGVRRKRLLFRCWHRGTQRDLILGPFVQTYLARFDADQERVNQMCGVGKRRAN